MSEAGRAEENVGDRASLERRVGQSDVVVSAGPRDADSRTIRPAAHTVSRGLFHHWQDERVSVGTVARRGHRAARLRQLPRDDGCTGECVRR